MRFNTLFPQSPNPDLSKISAQLEEVKKNLADIEQEIKSEDETLEAQNKNNKEMSSSLAKKKMLKEQVLALKSDLETTSKNLGDFSESLLAKTIEDS